MVRQSVFPLIVVKKKADASQQSSKGKSAPSSVARLCSKLRGRKEVFLIIGRIGDNAVELSLLSGIDSPPHNVVLYHLDAIGKGRMGHVIPGIEHGRSIEFDSRNASYRLTLCYH